MAARWLRVRPAMRVFVALAMLNGAWFGTKLATESPAPGIHVTWQTGLPEERRLQLEREFVLTNAEKIGESTFAYDLLDSSPGNIRRLVERPAVRDTHEIDRRTFALSPDVPRGRSLRWIVYHIVPDAPAVRAIEYALIACLVLSFAALRYATG